MLNLEVDGKPVQVPNGSTVMDAAHQLGLYVPHFCWHKKLSIAANCRMCLVQVEKAPKPLPACATPATEGMKVWTQSESAVAAQKGVMEFLLINHPLDCPICDQGGECQLQDLAVGYGASRSRYDEPKRVVLNKNLGPLISTDMTRCIHCTRCVRFGQEIAGVMELGMARRGEFAEILTFVGKTVDSELSGNMIDLCPVGALTSKPFRYTARTWELARRKSIAPHDALGSNIVVQVKNDRVMRVVPFENDAINECWLSDKDRFSYEGLNSDERLLRPQIRVEGKLVDTDWQTALERVATELQRVRDAHSAAAIGMLASPHATLEELHLAQKLVRGLGGDNIDFRLRQSDFSADAANADGSSPWLGMSVTDFAALDRVFVIGSFLRKDHPLLAHRLRQSAKKGAQIALLHPTDDDLLIKLAHRVIVAPSAMLSALAQVVVAAATAVGKPAPHALSGVVASPGAEAIAASLVSGQKKGVFLGNLAQQHAHAARLRALAQLLAELTGATLGSFTEAANSVGAAIVGAMPRNGGLNAHTMLATPRRAYVLLHAEPKRDCANAAMAGAALDAAEFVVALSPFQSVATDRIDVMLPIAPFTETAGTFVNCEGRVQSFTGVALPLGETRPAWKVLRVLGTMLGLPGFAQEDITAVRAEMPPEADIASRLSNRISVSVDSIPTAELRSPVAEPPLERVTDVPIYFADPLVRRAASLQKTADAKAPVVRANAATLARLGLASGEAARVRQRVSQGDGDSELNGSSHGKVYGYGEAIMKVAIDEGVADGCVRIAAAHASTSTLGAMFGPIAVETPG